RTNGYDFTCFCASRVCLIRYYGFVWIDLSEDDQWVSAATVSTHQPTVTRAVCADLSSLPSYNLLSLREKQVLKLLWNFLVISAKLCSFSVSVMSLFGY